MIAELFVESPILECLSTHQTATLHNAPFAGLQHIFRRYGIGWDETSLEGPELMSRINLFCWPLWIGRHEQSRTFDKMEFLPKSRYNEQKMPNSWRSLQLGATVVSLPNSSRFLGKTVPEVHLASKGTITTMNQTTYRYSGVEVSDRTDRIRKCMLIHAFSNPCLSDHPPPPPSPRYTSSIA